MKIHFLLSATLLLVTASGFSQAQKIRQAEQKKASTKPQTAIINTGIQQKAITKVTASNKVTLPDTLLIRNGSRIPLNTKTKEIKKK